MEEEEEVLGSGGGFISCCCCCSFSSLLPLFKCSGPPGLLERSIHVEPGVSSLASLTTRVLGWVMRHDACE